MTMKKRIKSLVVFIFTILLWAECVMAQDSIQIPSEFRYYKISYHGDPVEFLIKSRKGEENVKKPILLFCQGSQPKPLIIFYDAHHFYKVFVFNTDSLEKYFHLVIVSKPYIPILTQKENLDKGMNYQDSSNKNLKEYFKRNFIDYYTRRDIAVLKYLSKKDFVSPKKLVVSGHSEGAIIAARISLYYPKVSDLIYSSGPVLGREFSKMVVLRIKQCDSLNLSGAEFDYWKQVILNFDDYSGIGDSYKTSFQASFPPDLEIFRKLKIPVLLTYGTKDFGSVIGNDYWRLESIRLKKKNFTFYDYFGLDHNFFPINQDGSVNYQVFNWDRVALDWNDWLRLH